MISPLPSTCLVIVAYAKLRLTAVPSTKPHFRFVLLRRDRLTSLDRRFIAREPSLRTKNSIFHVSLSFLYEAIAS